MIRRFILLFSLCVSLPLWADSLAHIGAAKLSVEQDELQADVATIINGQTDEKVAELLNKCRNAMEDAIDGLESADTGGKTLAAQTEVIELIYLAAKEKNKGENGEPKPGSEGMMKMLRKMLGMDSNDGSNKPGGKQGEGKGDKPGDKLGEKGGEKPGKGADGTANSGSSADVGISDPHAPKEVRRIPKSMSGGESEMPSEFLKALDAYNKSLQR